MSLSLLDTIFYCHQEVTVRPPGTEDVDAGDVDPRLRDFERSSQTVRLQTVQQAKGNLWTAVRPDCVCLGEPLRGSSQRDSPGENCPYYQGTEEGAEIHTIPQKCGSQECGVYLLIDHCELDTLVQVGVTKNALLTTRLRLSKYIAHILNSGDIQQERMATITKALCSLLGCEQTKLRNVANTGFLTLLCPRLGRLQLERGWGNIFSNLSKIGSAVGHHETHRSQLAALIFLRKRCVHDPESNWHYYLQTEDEEEETEILNSVFSGCFEDES